MKRKVRTRKLGIKFKILIPVCVCVLVVCVVMGVNSYKHIQDGMVEMGVQEADMAADLTLRMLDGDEVEQIVPGAEESDAYKGQLWDRISVYFIYRWDECLLRSRCGSNRRCKLSR